MKRYAKIVSKNGKCTPNGVERIDQLRAGRKGKGRILHSCIVWPWSGPSEQYAFSALSAEAERQGYEIV